MNPAPAIARPPGPRFEAGAEVESFYHLVGCDLSRRRCEGTACFVAQNALGGAPVLPAPGEPRIACLGRCFEAPVIGLDRARPRIEVQAREGVVLSRLARGLDAGLAAYQSAGGGTALAQALRGQPSAVIEAVIASELRGRGGAAFPTGRKWSAVAAAPTPDTRWIVANADEGDAGAYIDRFILEGDPHAFIEGMTLAAFAVGASRGIIYLRHEYPYAQEVLEQALAEARAAGWLGGSIRGRDFAFEIEVFVGHGSYICGEETALLHSLAGQRPEPTIRPPYAASRGYLGRPTLVSNVETFATVPWIVERGGEAYRALGFSQSRGTKALSLNSLFVRPGLYEVEFGLPLRRIVEELGGGLRSGSLKGVIVGGPLAGIVPPHLLDTPLGFDELHAIGAAVGHGGVIAFDHSTSIAALVHHVLSFGASESCGKCTPCRLGTRRLEEIFARAAGLAEGPGTIRAEVEELIAVLRQASLCGHGVGLGDFAASALRYFGKELDACWP